MSITRKWHGAGLYSIVPRRGPCKDVEVFYGRVWIKQKKGQRDFPLGPGLAQAKRKLARIYADPEKALAERERQEVRAVTFGELLDEFLAHYHSRGETPYYQHITKAPREFFGDKPVTEMTVPDIDRYLGRRRSERQSNGARRVGESSLRKEIIAIGTVFRWAERRGLVGRNPVARIEKPKEPSERSIAILPPEQEEQLLSACPPLARDVVEWALYSGMRRGEVLALRWRDVDRARGVVHVVGSKTGKARVVPLGLSGRLTEILVRHPRRVDTDLVFHEKDGRALDRDVLNGILENASKAAGIPKARGVLWNRLRHTWATRLTASGKASIFDVAKIMGNSVAICERHYAAFLPGAHAKLSGALDGQLGTRASAFGAGLSSGGTGDGRGGDGKPLRQ